MISNYIILFFPEDVTKTANKQKSVPALAITLSLCTAFVLIVVISVFLFRRYRQRRFASSNAAFSKDRETVKILKNDLSLKNKNFID
jgi:hypothetical protein